MGFIDNYDFTNRYNTERIKTMPFGVNYLDKATGGILPNDLIVLGASTSAGKTEIASIIAQHNSKTMSESEGKSVYFFALEAEENEIQKRLLYRLFVDLWNTTNNNTVYYRDFYLNNYTRFSPQERVEIDECIKKARYKLRNENDFLKVFYRTHGNFGIKEMNQVIDNIQDSAKLIIIDHLQYLDYEGTNENQGVKDLCKRLRDMALLYGIPIILVSHLRKKNMIDKKIIPSLDDFHGTSDIVKIATKVILLSSYNNENITEPYRYSTLVQVAKSRVDKIGASFIGELIYNSKYNKYEDNYALGKTVDCYLEFKPLTNMREVPIWFKNDKNLVLGENDNDFV